jgi:hypothetical protein
LRDLGFELNLFLSPNIDRSNRFLLQGRYLIIFLSNDDLYDSTSPSELVAGVPA